MLQWLSYWFEFTIGRKFNEINEKTEIIFTKEGRKEMVISLKNEMKKAIEKRKLSRRRRASSDK